MPALQLNIYMVYCYIKILDKNVTELAGIHIKAGGVKIRERECSCVDTATQYCAGAGFKSFPFNMKQLPSPWGQLCPASS